MSEQRSASPVAPGELVGGKYRIETVLGAGAMGVVVSAVHEDLGERRAIKFLLAQAKDNSSQLERFMREARAAAKLRSGHVAHVFDVGKHETPLGQTIPYLVMEFLEGRDLYAVFHQDGPLSVTAAASFLLQACEGLSEAHAHGIVHRDLKPANLFIEERKGLQTLKVLDFGISKVQAGGQGAAELTETAMMIGSPSYMAPEQMRSSRSVDARADVWSLGVTLYQLLSGKLPFTGDDRIELCLKVVQDEPPRPTEVNPSLSPAVDAVVMRCLQKLPEHRYQDVGELAADLVSLAPTAANELLLEKIGRNLGQEALPRASRSGSIPTPPKDARTAAAWTGSSNARASAAIPKSNRGIATVAGLAVAAGLGAGIHFASRAAPSSPAVAVTSSELDARRHVGVGTGGTTVVSAEAASIAPVAPGATGSAAVAEPAGSLGAAAKPSFTAAAHGDPPGGASSKIKPRGTAAPQATAAQPVAPPPPPTAKPDRHTF